MMSTYTKLLTTCLPAATKLVQPSEANVEPSVYPSQEPPVVDEEIPSLDEILAMLGEPWVNDMPGS